MKLYKYILFFILFIGLEIFSLNAQPEYEHEGKVFTSLAAAMENPDEVTRLKLRRKKYSGIPSEVYKFKNLVELDLTGNKIVELSDSIALLTALEYLILERNKLKALPNSIAKLSKLKYLNIGKNQITEFNKLMSKLDNLEYIQAWGNEISEIPDEFYQLKNLKYLDIRAILINDDQREEMVRTLPNTQIYFSPSCNCKN